MPEVYGVCKICHKHSYLVKSHILPKAFYKDIAEENRLTIWGEDIGKQRKSAKGEYDFFLCSNCEKKFDITDHYGIRVLRGDVGEKMDLIIFGHKIEDIKVLSNISIVCLQKFFLSVILRAHYCSRPFCKHVNLSPLRLQKLEDFILSPDTTYSSNYPCFIQEYNSTKYDLKIISNIFQPKDDLADYTFMLGHYRISVNLKSRKNFPSRRFLEKLIQDRADNSEMLIFSTRFDGSGIHDSMLALACNLAK